MLKNLLTNLLILLFSTYFCFHLIWGQKGYLQYIKLEEKFQYNLKNFQILRAERVILENKAGLLNRSSLDLDSLDEYARKVLGMAKATEILVPAQH